MLKEECKVPYKTIQLVTGKRGGESLHYYTVDIDKDGVFYKKIPPRQFKHLDMAFYMREYDVQQVKPVLHDNTMPKSFGLRVDYNGYKRAGDTVAMLEFENAHNVSTLSNIGGKNDLRLINKCLFTGKINFID